MTFDPAFFTDLSHLLAADEGSEHECKADRANVKQPVPIQGHQQAKAARSSLDKLHVSPLFPS